MDNLPCQPPGPTVAHQLPGAGRVESLLLLLLSKRKHRFNKTASVQPQLPDKVCQDLYSLSLQAPSETTTELQTLASAEVWPAPQLSAPSVSVCDCLSFCICLSLCVFGCLRLLLLP